jgi:hypothetical protein
MAAITGKITSVHLSSEPDGRPMRLSGYADHLTNPKFLAMIHTGSVFMASV